ncbi:SH3 domain-containing protein [Vibrio vulnificus]|nr:SH3 domain-containing protein [Vibrio vulnificus]EIT7022771.1 SH3 domain-containing protein [Vibrio vulnificus]EIV8621011.1 SH3 domain-containing protein [Vibrio vulnificus]EKA7347431.1 SH3 domain-containing protein [Vibrio vulnificus]ELQ2525544.1 SH3 domain-containing protein [Vibrio vulnificus]
MSNKSAWYAVLTLSCLTLLGCQSTSTERKVSSVSSAQLSKNAEVLQQQLELTLSSQEQKTFLTAMATLLESESSEMAGGEEKEGLRASQWRIASSDPKTKTFLVGTDVYPGVTLKGELSLLDLPFSATTVVNLRSGPSAKSNKVGQLQTGDVFIALAKVPGAPWLLVERQGMIEGFVHQGYVQSRIEPRDILSVKPNAALTPKTRSASQKILWTGSYQCRDLQYQLNGANQARSGNLMACRKDKNIWYIQSIDPS